MRITENEKDEILNEFPKMELSYETIVHKKVYDADFMMAIPEGKKCFAWFTTFKNQNICFIMDITENKKISNIEVTQCCFHNRLSYGTIFYGTVFKHNNVSFFTVEDILYYNGVNIQKDTFVKKLDLFKIIFSSEIKQLAYSENQIIFGLPLMHTLLKDLVHQINLLPYKIKNIHFVKNRNISIMPYIKQNSHSQNNSQSSTNYSNKPTFNNHSKRELVFKIKPDIQNDIYHLFVYDEPDKPIGIAYISNYNTSVMMNKLFRNIKENQNLDALEESDDEDEFENDKIDKFVYLDKTYNMLCAYNGKYKKWEPLRIAQKNERITNKQQILF